MYRLLELVQNVWVFGHDFVSSVDLYVDGNFVDNSTLVERPEHN